jgi:hypothetical protein
MFLTIYIEHFYFITTHLGLRMSIVLMIDTFFDILSRELVFGMTISINELNMPMYTMYTFLIQLK